MAREEESVKKDKGPSFTVLSSGSNNVYATNMTVNFLGEMDPTYLTWETLKKMRKDPIISFAVEFMKSMIVNQKWWMDCEDRMIGDAITENFRPTWFDLADRGLDAYYWGFMPFEKIWMRGPLRIKVRRNDGTTWYKTFQNHVLLKKFKDLSPENWEPRYNPKTDEYLGLWPTRILSEYTKHIPFYKSFVMSFGKQFGNMNGFSRMNYVYRPWYSGRAVSMFADRHMEKKVDPHLKGRAPPGESKDENGNLVKNMPFMAEKMDRMRSGAPLVLPSVTDENGNPLFDVEALYIPERGEAFIAYMTYLDILKIRGLWLPENTLLSHSGRTSGTFAESEVHTQAALTFLERDSNTFMQHINDYVLPQLVRYNFGVEAMRKTPVTIRTDGFRKVDKVLLGHMIKDILAAQYKLQGKKYSAAHLVNLENLFRSANLPYMDPDEAIKHGATIDDFQQAAGAQNRAPLPGSRTKQPKPGERVPQMPGK